jgi:signal transduction histidine kinase/CheY-like chemotaxis protein
MYRREVVLELLQERRASRITLDSLSEGIAELSQDRRILVSNRAFQQIAGVPLGTMIARPLEEVFREGRPLLLGMFDEVDRGAPSATGVIRLGNRDLQINLHRIDSSVDPSDGLPGDDDGLPAGVRTAVRRAARTAPKVNLETMFNTVSYTVLVEDITQRVNAERERETLRSRLAQSQRMSAIGLFVAGAAHELNNPLTSVLGYSQLLLERRRASEFRVELERIAAGASRCKTILENLMAFARSNRPAKSLMDLNALLVESLSTYTERLRNAGVEVNLDLAPVLPATLADPLRIVQAFGCVIDNALRALSEVKGARSLAISSKAVAGTIIVEITDNGPGIPEEILSKVFEPFFTTRQVGQGAGLGLSVAYGMVTAHAGRISLHNRPDGGARIRLEFPVMTQEKEAGVEPFHATPQLAASPASRRILIVDDEAVVQELLVDMLKNGRDLIDTASNGHEGLRKIGGHEYDLIILDLRMPDMTGQQMYEELARLRPDLLGRLMFITADTLTPEVDRFLKIVGNPCLTKPFAVEAVMERVETILGGAGH